MNEYRKFRVRTPLALLKAGLALTIMLIVFVSYNTTLQLRDLKQFSNDIYQHPFLVSNAALELKSDIAQIRIRFMQITYATSVSEINDLSREIDTQAKDMDHQLEIISKSFLGDMHRVEELRSELIDWSNYRGEKIAKALDGTLTSEDKAAITAGSFTYRKSADDIDYISSFANNRAIQFIADANLRSSAAIEHLSRLTMLVVILLMIGGFYVFRTIHNYVIELQDHAHVDPLTGLLNRRQFHIMTDHEFGKLARAKNEMSVMMIDIDHFKNINDQHGHAVGDAVLVALSHSLREELRDTDLLCRWGGEEIVLLLPGICESAALEIAGRLNRKIAQKPVLAGHVKVNFTVSIGIAAYSTHANVADLISQADVALYHVKSNGRNGAVAYSSIYDADPAHGQPV